jgi:hypothetical protein
MVLNIHIPPKIVNGVCSVNGSVSGKCLVPSRVLAYESQVKRNFLFHTAAEIANIWVTSNPQCGEIGPGYAAHVLE